MPTIKMPQVGKSIQSATVRRWLKQVGQNVSKGEILLELETDEGLVQIESAGSGTLREIAVKAGTTVQVGAALGTLDEQGGGVAAPVAPPAAPAAAPANAAPGKPAGKVTPVLMPKPGQSMEEGTIVKWHVQAGATIKKGDIIFEIETDKATLEVEAADSGRLARITVPEGGTMKCLEPVGFLADNDADVDAYLASSGATPTAAPTAAPVAAASAPVAGAAVSAGPAATTDSGRVKASPAARKIASERGIDLGAIGGGSGPGGRILSTDVPASAPAARPAVAATAPAAGAPTPQGVVRKRMSQMRKAIARNLLASKQNIPHFYVRCTINAEPLFNFYQAEKAKYPCSLNDVVVMGCAKAMMEFPAFRSRIEGDEIVEFPSSNIGVAVGMDDGLVVPVVVGAEQLTLKQLGAEIKRIAANARIGKIEGMGQGLFTITNLGMFGVEEFSAIINPPEAAILAVGTVREEVIVSGGTLKAGRVMTMTLSADHRIIDGMLGAKFLARLKELLEWPAQLV